MAVFWASSEAVEKRSGILSPRPFLLWGSEKETAPTHQVERGDP